MTDDETQDDKLDMIRKEAETLFGKKDKYTSEEYGKAVTSLLKTSKKRKPRTPKKDKPPKATKTDPNREEYRKKIEQVVDNFTENGWAIPHVVKVNEVGAVKKELEVKESKGLKLDPMEDVFLHPLSFDSEPVLVVHKRPWIVDGKCNNDGKNICDLGYACDGCPYNKEGVWE